MMEEEAMEELKKLESEYPNHFEYLKDEIRSFIIQLQSNNHDSQQMLQQNNHFDTQESTCLVQKKRRKYGLAEKVVIEGKIDEGCEPESSPRTVILKECSNGKNKRKNRVDLVLERAQACLKKIRCLKTSLLLP